MKKRLQFYLNYYETLTTKKSLTTTEAAREQEQLLIQIQFFQHERPIHFNRNGTFCTAHDIELICHLLLPKQPVLLALDILFLVLLIPYIFHYYRLENGVQKLYEYYDKLSCR